MERLIKYLAVLLLGAGAASCYGIPEEQYPELSPITILAPSDTINADIGVELHYEGITIESDLPVTCEWAYGAPEKNTTVEQHQFALRTILETTSPTIDHTFTKLGSYILRLKVDNGESIAYKYFRLNVNSGLDEGVAILSNDPEGNADITFVKTLTAEEKARGDQQLFHVEPVEGLRNGRGLYMSSYSITMTGSKQEIAGLVIATDDEDGTLYLFEPKSFELVKSDRMSAWNTSFGEFSGQYGGAHDFGVFFNSEDGRVFRFDLILGYLSDISNFPEGLTRSYPAFNRSNANSATSIYPFFFNDKVIATRTSVSAGVKTYQAEGFRIVNLAAARTLSDVYGIYVILQSESDPSSYQIRRIYKTSSGSGTWMTVQDEEGNTVPYHIDFKSSDLKMDSHSKVLNTKASNDVYYTYGNAIYRWSLSAPPATRPAISLPAGEEIRDIATNYMGPAASAADAGEDLLYIVTYNPNRSGAHKGSLYIYRFADDSLVSAYEGICDDPVSVLYKYRLS